MCCLPAVSASELSSIMSMCKCERRAQKFVKMTDPRGKWENILQPGRNARLSLCQCVSEVSKGEKGIIYLAWQPILNCLLHIVYCISHVCFKAKPLTDKNISATLAKSQNVWWIFIFTQAQHPVNRRGSPDRKRTTPKKIGSQVVFCLIRGTVRSRIQ